ncbi:MAG: hypothetical protein ACM3RP_11730 [Chitinophagales bacterium]
MRASDFVRLSVQPDGTFALQTVNGFPGIATDDNQTLVYVSPAPRRGRGTGPP